MYELYQQFLKTLQRDGKYRKLTCTCQAGNSELLDFSTNDYLNLSRHGSLINEGMVVARAQGFGSTGSRLLSGNSDLYEEFESLIAKDKNSEAGLIFNSGFQANISTLSCLLDQKILNAKPLVFFDRLNHASLYQAVFLSSAQLCRYRHNDMNHLEFLLSRYKNESRPKFIVTETVFGMDGDIAPIEHIAELTFAYNAFLYLDEAHATGVFGKNGYGLSTSVDLRNIPHVVMGTFSKALGASGGYVACHNIIRDFLINNSKGFIYSTALSPPVIGAAFCAWQLVESFDKEREILRNLGKSLRRILMDNGFDIGSSQTHIVPVILHEESACLRIKELLADRGIIVSCIRPPTVPPGTARLRIALTAKHRLSDLERLVTALKEVF
ncbi:MAG: 8-amino-7-oxononanoate synthase [Victivallaceae bacterium]